jgi:hypothetical protein
MRAKYELVPWRLKQVKPLESWRPLKRKARAEEARVEPYPD